MNRQARTKYWKTVMANWPKAQLQQAAKHGVDADPRMLEEDDYAYREAAQEILKEKYD